MTFVSEVLTGCVQYQQLIKVSARVEYVYMLQLCIYVMYNILVSSMQVILDVCGWGVCVVMSLAQWSTVGSAS